MIDDRDRDRDRDRDADDLLAGVDSRGDDCVCVYCGALITLDALKACLPQRTRVNQPVTTGHTCPECDGENVITIATRRNAGRFVIELRTQPMVDPVYHDVDPLGIDADGNAADGRDPLAGADGPQDGRTEGRD